MRHSTRNSDVDDKTLLQVSDLKTYFETLRGTLKAVDGVSLRIDEKQMLGLVGESGAGKSMTGLSIMRLVPPQGKIVKGRITFKGKNLLELSEEDMREIRGKEISIVFQDPLTFLNPLFTVGDQIAEMIMMHQDVTKDTAREKAIKMLEQTRIPSPNKVVDYYPYQLSGGMRQRVLIGIALSCSPSLVIADEPTTALDVTVQAQILELISDLREKFAISLLLITHDLGIVAETCDHVNIMYAGEIVERGNVFSFYDEPLHPYTSGLLSSVLSIDEFKENLVAIEGTPPDPTEFPSGCRFHPRCPKVMKICREKHPPTVELERQREVTCWLYG